MNQPTPILDKAKDLMRSEDARRRILVLDGLTRKSDYEGSALNKAVISLGLEDKDDAVVIAALHAFHRTGDSRLHLVTKAIAEDANPEVRAAAVLLPVHHGIVPELHIQMGMEDEAPTVVAAALAAAKRCNVPCIPRREIRHILSAHQGDDELIYAAIDYCRGVMKHPTFTPDTPGDWAYDEVPAIRAAAMGLMDVADFKQYADEIWGGMEDKFSIVRQEALRTIAHACKLDPKEEVLTNAIDDIELVHTMLDELLAGLTRKQYENGWAPYIEKAARSEDVFARQTAVRILAKMEEEGAEVPHICEADLLEGYTKLPIGDIGDPTHPSTPDAVVKVRRTSPFVVMAKLSNSYAYYFTPEAIVLESELDADGEPLVPTGTILTDIPVPFGLITLEEPREPIYP